MTPRRCTAKSPAYLFVLVFMLMGFYWPFVARSSAQIQDLDNFSEIRVWFIQDDTGSLVRIVQPWNRAPYHLVSELISDVDFVQNALKLPQEDQSKLERYLKGYYQKQDEADQSVWHYPTPEMNRSKLYKDWLSDAQVVFDRELPFVDVPKVEIAYQRYLLVSLGFEAVVVRSSLVPKLPLDDHQRKSLLAALHSERIASSERASAFHKATLDDIESVLTESQRREFERLYGPDVRNLIVPWELQLGQLELNDRDARIKNLMGDEKNAWLLLPNDWSYRITGQLVSEKYVSPYVPTAMLNETNQYKTRELESMQRLLKLLDDPEMNELLELSRHQEDELKSIRQSLAQFSQDTVESRFTRVQEQMALRKEIPDGQLDGESLKKVREQYLKETVAAQLRLLRPVSDLLVPRQRQQLETLQVKVETRSVGIMASFRHGKLGRSLELSGQQLVALDKLREIKRKQLNQVLIQEENLFWNQLDKIWTDKQREAVRQIRHDSQEFFRPAPGLLLLSSHPN